MFTNEDFLQRVEKEIHERHMTLYQLSKKVDPMILKESTLYSMFKCRSAAKIEYIFEIGRALGLSFADLCNDENGSAFLKPIQVEILNEFSDLEEA